MINEFGIEFGMLKNIIYKWDMFNCHAQRFFANGK